MAEGTGATLTVHIKIEEEGDGYVMFEDVQTFRGLKRIGVLTMQRMLIRVLRQLNKLGFATEVVKGRESQDDVDLAKAAADDSPD
jgi:hypothetical protein